MAVDRLTASPFRRRQFQASRSRRSLALRLLKPFLGATALIAVPLAVAAWVLTSPAFALKRIEVSGVERVSAGWVRQALAPLNGRHLLRVRLAEIQSLVVRHPWVRSVEIRKELPDRLVVDIVEREPVALMRRGEGLSLVDRDGTVFAPYRPEWGTVDLPLIGGIGADELAEIPAALGVIERWSRARPDGERELSEVESLGNGDYRVFSAALPFPVLVSGARLEEGLGSLARLLPQIERRYPEVRQVDLRFSQQIVIQPAALPRVEQG
jgi:cell division septal protein FtsQ